ncbi:testis-specific serine/threonine-protein kinase 4-like [Ostrea edulis]|uniref:testis-specific serine/threonine-protein kinase 4-like n=1 Tax=Ostrea edulis TaxID=37623 RepID=UPI002095B6EE|nr:testis-specific serine/threonine-protein kinase 4-like [Ostrea edulis]
MTSLLFIFQILETQGFIVGRMLGQGSYASVRSAFDANRRHKVAIKIISKRKAPEDFLCRFLPREIEVIKILKHPCLISFYQVIETTTRFFLVMELGHVDMLDYIRCKKAIPEVQCGIWFRQFHDGMVYMHAKGVVHRDLKCENILLDKDYHLKITDFGFAKKVPTPKNLEEVPPSETYCGSFAYAPPEILMGTPYNPFFADVWSMGVVLFTMLYGRLPFDDSNHKKLLNQVQKRVVFPTKPEVSEACQTLLAKMLSLLPERVLLSNIQFEPWFKMFEQEDDKKSDNEETLIETQNLTSELDGEAS